jgi:hypothetical protein
MQVLLVIAVALISLVSMGCAQKFVKMDRYSHLRGRKFIQPYTIEDTTSAPALHEAVIKPNSLTRDRLAVMILFSFPIESNGTHAQFPALHCSLQNLYNYVKPHTPLDVFLWVNASTVQHLPDWLLHDFEDLHIMAIDENSWQISPLLARTYLWTFSLNFSAGYHLMGRWRLSFAPDFAHRMGYKYMMIMDDDLFFNSATAFNFNLVHTFNSERTALAYRNKKQIEIGEVVDGLPELVKYWMVTRNVTKPWGPLMDDFTPNSLASVSSENWNRETYGNSFYVVNLDFWFEPPVQDFLDLVFNTGGDMMQRWNEQGVMNMMRILFLPKEHVYIFPQNTMLHEKVRDPRVYKLMGCLTAKALQEEQQTIQPYYRIADNRTEIKTVELLIVFENHRPLDVRTEDLKEIFLFHWMYNATSCGADTVALNEYSRYEPEIQVQFLRELWWWSAYEVDKKLSVILADSEIRSVEPNNIYGESACRDIARQQLENYVEFYCAYTGIHQGKPMAEFCKNLRGPVLAML